MNAEKWAKINELFHSALELEADKRLQFIKTGSGDDDEIFAEVKKLISTHEEAKNFIRNPMAEDALKVLSNQNNSTILTAEKNLLSGKNVGHFEIISPIGKGGMGEVFLGHDKSLEREIALKILPQDFTLDSSRVSRFIREAKAASALNHPNILTIHEIGEFNGTHFIASEYINGQTLTTFLSQEKLTIKKILQIAIQIVSALQTAHEAGIAHRDIKPDNVMIRQDGIVKVLDFGLAKLLENSNNHKSRIPSPKFTIPGLIMGTPNYMSPEQARGKDIDFQTDIFSFGVVLYEMLSGKLPFQGESVNDIIAAVLTKQPEPLNEIPPELAKIVHKCLQKDKQNRYQTAKSLLQDLEEFSEDLQIQSRLEKTFTPNREEAKTQVLNLTTVDENQQTVVTENIGIQSKSLKKYLVAGLAAILLAVAGFFGYQNLYPSKQIESIAVMPFVNESGNAEMEYLSDGMTETLIKNLSNIPNLSVKARSSVFRYKGQETDLKKIALELNVQAVVTGRIIQRGDEITLSLDLVEAATEKNLWNERYTRKQSDLVSLQNEIAKDVSINLKAKLTGAETDKITNSGTTNPEAYQSYLKGRYFLTKGTIDAPQQSLKYFRDAVALDPKFALGYSGLADCYTLLGTMMQARATPEETMPQAKTAAEKAIELDPNLSEAYVSLAWTKFRYDWDWAGAEKDFKKAIELNPNNAQAHQWYGEFLSVQRRDEQALVEFKKAVELEPFNLLMQWNYAKAFNDFGRYREALPEIKKVYEMDKNFQRAYRVIRQAYAANGMEAEAFDIFIKEGELRKEPPEKLEFFRKMYREKGYQETMNWFLKNVLIADKNTNTAAKAVYYASLKDKENTLHALEEAYQQRLAGVLYCRFVGYDFLKDEPRYQELLRKLNFPQ